MLALADHLMAYLGTYSLSEFGCDKTLVGQTCDGAAVTDGHVTGIQTDVLSLHPHALFAHCYARSVNLFLQQSLAIFKESNKFLSSKL
jgi:hypothetical protein